VARSRERGDRLVVGGSLPLSLLSPLFSKLPANSVKRQTRGEKEVMVATGEQVSAALARSFPFPLFPPPFFLFFFPSDSNHGRERIKWCNASNHARAGLLTPSFFFSFFPFFSFSFSLKTLSLRRRILNGGCARTALNAERAKLHPSFLLSFFFPKRKAWAISYDEMSRWRTRREGMKTRFKLKLARRTMCALLPPSCSSPLSFFFSPFYSQVRMC